jgi:hypothetical protein
MIGVYGVGIYSICFLVVLEICEYFEERSIDENKIERGVSGGYKID